MLEQDQDRRLPPGPATRAPPRASCDQGAASIATFERRDVPGRVVVLVAQLCRVLARALVAVELEGDVGKRAVGVDRVALASSP